MITGIPLLLIILSALSFIIIGCSVFRWHPLLVLLITSLLLGLAVGMPVNTLLSTLTQGAGSVFAAIGLIIALGTILGEILEKTMATQTLAKWIIHLSGKDRVIRGMSILGGVTGIPVFCDSGFIILSSLGRSLSLQTKTSYGAISIALATGLYATHVLVPPTPGPMAAAGNLGATDQLGLVILLGLILSIPAIWMGNFMATRLMKVKSDTAEEIIEPVMENENLPGVFRSFIPLLLPVILITLGSILPFLTLPSTLQRILEFVSNPTIALLIAVLAAVLILPVPKEWNGWINSALSQAGPIILITVAGGAFGAVLKATPLAELFGAWMNGQELSPIALFPVVFLLAAGLKTAQGSSTASLVITSSILAPLLPVLGMEGAIEKALLVLTIGGGAMAVSHANDSYFWVIQQYSGLSVQKMYRYFTLTTLFMGITVLVGCILIASILRF